MKLLVGLGNPGGKHERNRHNIGFLAVERIGETNGFGNWRSRHLGLLAEGRLGKERVLLFKPQSYMNRSGQSVGEAMRYHRLTPSDIVVFHDELDLAPGKIRAKSGGGHAGHNGLRSIHQHIGPDFGRVRLGIGHPGERHLVTGHVLGDFSRADREWIDDLLDALESCAAVLADDGIQRFQECIGNRRARQTEELKRSSSDTSPSPDKADQDSSGPFQGLLKLIRGPWQGR